LKKRRASPPFNKAQNLVAITPLKAIFGASRSSKPFRPAKSARAQVSFYVKHFGTIDWAER
jgi:hypothetical protein